MKRKVFAFLIISLFAASFSLAQKNRKSTLEQYSQVKFKIETSGDISYGRNENYSKINVAEILKELNKAKSDKNQWFSTISVYIGCSTIYDYVSNATPRNVVQDPNNSNRIHSVFMSSPLGDPYPNFPGRLLKYYYSSNKGTNWSFVSSIGPRAGFPEITLDPSGRELIAGNIGSVGTESVRWYYDAAPGLGSFTEIFPTLNQRFLFPRTVFTNSLTNLNKFISVISSFDLDSTFWFSCTSLSPTPGTFTPLNFLNAKPEECYAIARGDDGRIGIVYITNNLLSPVDIGDVYFVETTNQGNTFSSPLKIFDANISPSGDSLGAFRGISMVYRENTPYVAFETVKQTTNGYYFPGAPAKIRLWSSSLPGVDPYKSIVIVDTSNLPFKPYISKGLNNDLFASVCRPTIGISSCGGFYDYLFVSFMAPSARIGGSYDSVSFMDVYMVYSNYNIGSLWHYPVKINPTDTNNYKDWTYPSISPKNDCNPPRNYFNLVLLSDSIPGSYINHNSNGQSLAKYYFVRGEFFIISIKPISNAIPKSYRLYQNYPNPFNPLTKIRFDLPKTSNTKIKIYDILGKEIATLVNEKLSPGTYEIPFSISNVQLPSGLYFYKFSSDEFSDTKKLIILK